mmetsp:Transcript_32303/g.75210  ORF Transcript_32303/g.75210 Transcript_32303/m.75210 type:complete len:154 (-) Transcript_32303:15-476(-)
MAPIPDSPCGLRFCRDCNEFKPIGEFPKGKRRYQCRKHVEERCKQWRRKAGVSKKVLARVWHAAYMDARAVFQRKVTKLSQADVAKLFAEDGIEPAVSFRALPVDPSAVISADNAILVSMDERRRLVREWATNEDAERYREMVLQLQGRDLVR